MVPTDAEPPSSSLRFASGREAGGLDAGLAAGSVVLSRLAGDGDGAEEPAEGEELLDDRWSSSSTLGFRRRGSAATRGSGEADRDGVNGREGRATPS
jgi:hypothetical protein